MSSCLELGPNTWSNVKPFSGCPFFLAVSVIEPEKKYSSNALTLQNFESCWRIKSAGWWKIVRKVPTVHVTSCLVNCYSNSAVHCGLVLIKGPAPHHHLHILIPICHSNESGVRKREECGLIMTWALSHRLVKEWCHSEDTVCFVGHLQSSL